MKNTWHAGRILVALARYFDWQRNYLMPEYEIGGRADLVVITPARYVTEIEIKISLADWRSDFDKAKWRFENFTDARDVQWWRARRAHISRFFYAIPETLEAKIPGDLPEGVGIIVVRHDEKYGQDTVVVIREAVRRKSIKLSEAEFARIMRTCYFRYWNVQWDLERLKHYNEELRQSRRVGL